MGEERASGVRQVVEEIRRKRDSDGRNQKTVTGRSLVGVAISRPKRNEQP